MESSCRLLRAFYVLQELVPSNGTCALITETSNMTGHRTIVEFVAEYIQLFENIAFKLTYV